MKLPLVALLALTLVGAGCRLASSTIDKTIEPIPVNQQASTTRPTATTTSSATTTPPTATTTAPKPATKPAVKAPVKKPVVVTSQVQIMDASFSPQILAINAGDTVVWTNKGSKNQTVTSNSNLWDSGNLKPGQTYKRVFAQPGRYEYRTNLTNGMNGTIIVGPVRP